VLLQNDKLTPTPVEAFQHRASALQSGSIALLGKSILPPLRWLRQRGKLVVAATAGFITGWVGGSWASKAQQTQKLSRRERKQLRKTLAMRHSRFGGSWRRT
jgi:hypothetical protein